ncbi:MAG: hypothetical protein WBY44_37380 [Bryobacteraceae bacterium]
MRRPTDEEWATHRKRRRLLQRQLGRGATETEIESSDADSRLYEAIKLNGAPPLSPGEASRIVETIALCDVVDRTPGRGRRRDRSSDPDGPGNAHGEDLLPT